MAWLYLAISPFVAIFIYPVIVLLAMYSAAIFINVYLHRRRQLYVAYTENFWIGGMQTVAAVVDAHGEFWHGYEMHGLDKLPDKGPALLIYYHGAIPIDMYYIMARLILQKKRRLRNVAATFLFYIPGMQLLLEVFGVVEGRTREQCLEILKNGDLLAISPGGVREALFSDEYYGMIWNSRKGFAKVALAAKVPVYPVFTQNVREAMRTVKTGRGLLRMLFEWTKLPLVPLYGGFPVKMRTIIGDPVTYDPNVTVDDLTEKIKNEIEKLINKHQRIPGSIVAAFGDRWSKTPWESSDNCKKTN